MSRTCLINMLASYHFISLKGAEFLSVVKKTFFILQLYVIQPKFSYYY